MNKYVKGAIVGAASILVVALPCFASDYTVNPTDGVAIASMTTGATSSFLGLFESNWPTIVTFAITILGFFFIWNLVKGMLKSHH